MYPRETTAGQQSARALAELLEARCVRIVLAESCTCGMAAALLGTVPGISKHLCGSAVTYRPQTKVGWLGLQTQQIQRDTAESIQTSRHMAIAVLQRTPEAEWSAAITGNLGPNSEGLDGMVFISVATAAADLPGSQRDNRSVEQIMVVAELGLQLKTPDRSSRQMEAAQLILDQLAASIQASDNQVAR